MIVKKGSQNSDCAIILTVHNHIEIFGLPCLQSLLKHSGGARIYVYDNESTDPKIENLRILADSRSEVEFIRIDDQKPSEVLPEPGMTESAGRENTALAK